LGEVFYGLAEQGDEILRRSRLQTPAGSRLNTSSAFRIACTIGSEELRSRLVALENSQETAERTERTSRNARGMAADTPGAIRIAFSTVGRGVVSKIVGHVAEVDISQGGKRWHERAVVTIEINEAGDTVLLFLSNLRVKLLQVCSNLINLWALAFQRRRCCSVNLRPV
jgi:hypothetical protein